VADPIAYMLTVKNQPALIEAVLYQAATGVIAQMKVDDVLASGLETLRAQTMRIAQAQLDQLGIGVQLLAFEVRGIIPAPQVLQAFEDVVSASVESRTFIEQANSYHASELPGAQAEAYRIKQEASAYAQDLVARATGEASAFAAIDQQYRVAPQLMRTRLYADAMETILHQLQSTTILPAKSGNLKLFLQPGGNLPTTTTGPPVKPKQQ